MRITHALTAFLLVFICLFPWAANLYALLAQPLLAKLPQGGQMIATDVTTPFFVPIKVAMLAAFVIALPYILLQVWKFVAPGLYAHEKRLLLPLIVASVILFLMGMGFVYFAVLPAVFGFITATAPQGVAVMTDIDKYLSFVLSLFMAFGVAFQLPVAVVVMVRMGVVTTDKLREIRPYIIVGTFIVGAIFTPPDVISQFMLAVPMWLLYEAGIIVAARVPSTIERAA